MSERPARCILGNYVGLGVEWISLAEEEQAKFDSMAETGEEAPWADVVVYESGGTEYVEFHVDVLGGATNEVFDSLCNALGEDGGSYSIRFNQAARAPCD